MASHHRYPLANIFKRLLGHGIRAEGFTALIGNNCKACSSYDTFHKNLKIELDAMVTIIEQLVEAIKED